MNTNSHIAQIAQKSSKRQGLTNSETREWIFAFLLFLLSGPYFVWERMYIYLLAGVLLVFLSFNQLSFKKNDFIIPVLLLFIHFFFQVKLAYSGKIPNTNGILNIFLQTFILIPFFFYNQHLWAKILKKYLLIFSITLIPSIIQFALSTYLNINFTYNLIEECPLNSNRNYFQYLLFVELPRGAYSVVDFPRFFAYYDEPGVLGNIAMVLLYIERFNLKRWYNVPIFIAGILSFSLLFYVAMLIYILLFSKLKYKIMVGIAIIALITYAYNDEVLYHYIFSRFEIVDGEWIGGNRENFYFELWFSRIKLKDYFLMGFPLGENVVYAASYKWAMVLFGVIPSILYLGLLIVRALIKLGFKKEFVIYSLIPLMIWYQRPFVFMPLYTFLMVVPLYYLVEQKYKDRLTSALKL